MTAKQTLCLMAYLGYYDGPVNDIWTDECAEATRQFQQDFGGIAVDGIAGPETGKALKRAVADDMFKANPAAGNTTAKDSTAVVTFKKRTTKPVAGNKYYITKANGGYSNAVKGKPSDPDCDVLANCVGYAYGRFNEIGGYGYCKYLSPVNAEKFIQYAGGLEVGQIPKLGACMVWKKGATLSGDDGAGHVAIVEEIISATQVMTSESGYNSKAFWTQIRNKGSGNWGMGANYEFLGFIYNPAVSDDGVSGETVEQTHNTSVPTEPLKFSVGSIVAFTGTKHFSNACALTGLACTPGKVKITSVYKNGYHQYHVIGVSGGGSTAYGWVDADDLKAL